MAYEVPQELEYREKIIFGLDFEQLIYAVIFAPLALIIFFKTGFNQEIKIVLVSFIVILAGGFMFLNFKKKILDFWSWYKFREFKVASLKMRKFIPVKDIQDNTIEIGGKNAKNSNNKSSTN